MKPIWKRRFLIAGITIATGILVYMLVQTLLAKRTGFETKTLWDWMELFIIPLVLAVGAYLLNRSEKDREREATNERIREDHQIAETRIKEERQLAEDRAKLEREIASDRQQEAALQSYLDRMTELLLKEELRTTKKTEVRDVARTRTLSVMRGLGTKRKNLVLQFLREAKLVTDENSILNDANMEDLDLQRLDLNRVHLHRANLEGASLFTAKLFKANLVEAILFRTNLVEANLEGANLEGANLEKAHSKRANLKGANLTRVNLTGANLTEADLSGADLSEARVTDEQLATAMSLKGATMPNGTKHV